MREFLRTWLGRHLALILIVKLVALTALWAAFFAAPVRVDEQAVARALIAPPAQPQEDTK